MRWVVLALAALAITAVLAQPPTPSGIYARGAHDVNTTLAPGVSVNVTAQCDSGYNAHLCSCNMQFRTAEQPTPLPSESPTATVSGRNCTCEFIQSNYTFVAFEWRFITFTDCVAA